VLGLALYRAGWRKGDPVRLTAAFLSVAAGMLVHFSAGPYAVFLGLHYLAAVWPSRRQRWRELGVTALFCTLLLSTWFYWAGEQFGTGRAFGSNTTMQEFQNPETSWSDKVGNMAHNVLVSVLPHPVQLPKAEFDQVFTQRSALGYLRDYVFLIYQVNFIFAMGSVGGALVLYLLGRSVLRGGWNRRSERRFWLLMIGFCGVVGVLVHPMRDLYGVAHICGQPLVYLGVTYLAANYGGLPPVARWLGVVGCSVDFALGIFLHFSLENRLFTFRQAADGPLVVILDPGLSQTAKEACAMKFLDRVTFLGAFAPYAGIIQGLLVVGFLLAMWRMVSYVRSLDRGAVEHEPRGAKTPVMGTADSITSQPNGATKQAEAVSVCDRQ
jgi:4-amino-4-deoxy-L-arabinose transferase-like glycosyltransferase